jgi:hypothetical protein
MKNEKTYTIKLTAVEYGKIIRALMDGMATPDQSKMDLIKKIDDQLPYMK